MICSIKMRRGEAPRKEKKKKTLKTSKDAFAASLPADVEINK